MSPFNQVDLVGVKALAQDYAPRAFLIGIDRSAFSKPVVTLHTVRDRSDKVDGAVLRQRFAHDGVGARCKVRRHNADRLERAHSLEAFLRRFQHHEVISDPTGCFDRASSLVAFSAKLREHSEKGVAGLYWHSDMRTIYVVFNHKDFVTDRKVKVAELGAAENLVRQLLAEACVGEYVPSIRLGFELPDLPLVPIDDLSYFNRNSIMRWLRRNGAVPALGALLGLGVSGAALAADLDDPPPGSEPAVSEPNGKLSLGVGVWDEDQFGTNGTGKANGSFSLPLGHSFGLQADGWLGGDEDRTFGGAGAHLFWRDPSVGLLGAIGSFGFMDYDGAPNEDLGRLGGEGELYLDQFSIAASAGYQFGDHVDNGFFGNAELRWYLSPDFLVSGGGEWDPEREGLGTVGVEFQPGISGLPGLSLFADGAFGANDLVQVFFGVRYYFGSPKSLMDRHRRDDPGNLDTSKNHVAYDY
jgi:hypothetical protein